MERCIILLLLVCLQCRFVDGRGPRAAWIAYINKMAASCTNLQPRDLGSFRQSTALCLNKQQLYLHCSSHQSDVVSTEQGLGPPYYYKPCGSIVSRFRSQQNPVEQAEWLIRVNLHLYVNVTFLEFNLSKSYTDCKTAVEVL